MMKYQAPCLALIFIGPQISKWINCNENYALVPLPNDFLITLLAKQCSHICMFSIKIEPVGAGNHQELEILEEVLE